MIEVGVLIEIDWTNHANARLMKPDERRLVAKVLGTEADARYPGWLFVRAESSRTKKTYVVSVPPPGMRPSGPRVSVRK